MYRQTTNKGLLWTVYAFTVDSGDTRNEGREGRVAVQFSVFFVHFSPHLGPDLVNISVALFFYSNV